MNNYKGYKISILPERRAGIVKYVGYVYHPVTLRMLDRTAPEEFAIDAEHGAEVLAENLPTLEE